MRGHDDEDERFLRRLIRRDEAAFSAFVERYKAMVLRCTRSVLRDEADAEDAAQDAFVVLFKRIHTFRGESSLKTWVYRVARNTALNRARARARRHHDAHEPLDAGHEAGIGEHVAPSLRLDPAADSERRELASSLNQELDALDPSFREILILRDVEELSYDEIAELLELAVGTVKSRLFRARAAMRQRMEAIDE